MLHILYDRLERRSRPRLLGVKPFNQWELWSRLALVLTGGFLLLFGIFSLLSLQVIDDSTERLLQGHLVIAEMAAGEIDDLLNRAFDELEKATDFAPFDPRASNLAAESHMLAHAYGRIGTLSLGVAFLDGTGRVVLTEPYNLSPAGDDWSSEPYIQRALSAGERQISDPFLDPRTQRPAVAVAVPIRDEAGQVISLLTGLIDLTGPAVRAPLKKAQQLGHTGHTLIVNEEGLVVASTVPGSFLEPGEHQEFYRRMLAEQRSGVESVPTHGDEHRPHIMAFVPLESAPWGMAVGGDTAEILAPIRWLRNSILLLGTLSLVSVLAATLFGARRLVRPVKDLTHAAQRLAEGDLDHPIAIGEGGEIGLLAQNLETMRWRLGASFREIQAWNDELEHRVQQRTRELEAVNVALREKEAGHRHLLARVITAQEEERIRIARELHDGTGQVLVSLVMSLEAIELSLPPETAAVRERVTRTRILAEQTVADIRRLIADLRPGVLDEMGLVAAIRWCAENHLESLGIGFSLRTEGLATSRLPEELETVLFRITQEAVGNIARHAGATQVNIQLSRRDGRVCLTIEDDGAGFDPEAVRPARDGTRGLGLASMRERASLAGGEVHIRSQAGHGTRIEVEVPLFKEVAL
ncbi:MAG: histidine kinase [Ardenticatenaceae bacterium]|nr:histidine kinase [Ardenticatenaceae bacterium]